MTVQTWQNKKPFGETAFWNFGKNFSDHRMDFYTSIDFRARAFVSEEMTLQNSNVLEKLTFGIKTIFFKIKDRKIKHRNISTCHPPLTSFKVSATTYAHILLQSNPTTITLVEISRSFENDITCISVIGGDWTSVQKGFPVAKVGHFHHCYFKGSQLDTFSP